MANPTKTGHSMFATIVGLAFMGLLIYLVILVGKLFFQAMTSVKPEITGPSIAGIIAIVGSVLVLAIGKYLEKKMEVDAAFRERRLATYEKFIATFDSLGEGKTPDDIAPTLRRTNTEMLLWAGPKLLKSYIAFYRQTGINPGSGRMFLAWEALYKAMREDLGHSNSGLATGDVLALRIKLSELDAALPRILKYPDEPVTGAK